MSKRIKYGSTGLPLPSTLSARHVGKVYEDNSGNLKEVVRKSAGKYGYVKAQVDELSKTRAKYYYKQVDKHLEDPTQLKKILVKVLKEVQPEIDN